MSAWYEFSRFRSMIQNKRDRNYHKNILLCVLRFLCKFKNRAASMELLFRLPVRILLILITRLYQKLFSYAKNVFSRRLLCYDNKLCYVTVLCIDMCNSFHSEAVLPNSLL